MAKPRIFVSSTYYDLKHIRDRLEAFIENFGYEPVLFESGDIPFHHDRALDESCYAEINLCHILVLLIGGRYGSMTSDEAKETSANEKIEFYNSITKKEYTTARDRDIPIFIFVEKNVLAEYETYKNNKESDIKYAHVDSKNIFKLLDEILAKERNNFIRGFERFDDVATWLRDQWAGLFADLITKKGKETSLEDLDSKLNELGNITNALKQYSEAMLRGLQPESSENIIQQQEEIIESSRAQSFSKEPLIRYLLQRFESEYQGTISEKIAYQKFETSPAIKPFLTAIGFDEKFINTFIQDHEEKANRDFDKIKNKYLNTTSTPQSETPQPATLKTKRKPISTNKKTSRAASTPGV